MDEKRRQAYLKVWEKVYAEDTPSAERAERRAKARANWAICQTCPHFGEHQYAGMKRTGCGLLTREADSPLPEANRKPCRTFDHIYAGGSCLDDPPRFEPVDQSPA